MNKEKFLRIQRELDRTRMYSDCVCEVKGTSYDDGQNSIVFTHYDSRYPYNNNSIFIYDFQDDEAIEKLANKAKEVMSGEALIE
ncbi:hypothetical protein [Staphylococcus ratti]|uniref:Phage protein n=1 Tax=Staphylococcus ratti TaxID=2892440 RepID=A0ABY3PBN2_9STAP|nr:hypothetical protein [Staphylococcus ratti]UEX89718.1 hypothetical protein LN051_09125 [Staphylococcus ratti]